MRWARLTRSDVERGSASIEAAIIVPAVGLLVLLVALGGRLALAQQVVQSAAADAARSASLERDAGASHDAATMAAEFTLESQGTACASIDVAVDAAGVGKAPGESFDVTVTVTCTVALADLALPGVPGTRTVTATMTSPVDRWRSQ